MRQDLQDSMILDSLRLCGAEQGVRLELLEHNILKVESADESNDLVWLQRYCEKYRALFISHLVGGAILFRGFDDGMSHHVKRRLNWISVLLDGLNLRPHEGFWWSGRIASFLRKAGCLSKLAYHSLLRAGDVRVQGPHNEQAFFSKRPRFGCFFSLSSPTLRGDTGFFHNGKAFLALPLHLKKRLISSQIAFPLVRAPVFTSHPAVVKIPGVEWLLPQFYFFGGKLAKLAHQVYADMYPKHALETVPWDEDRSSGNILAIADKALLKGSDDDAFVSMSDEDVSQLCKALYKYKYFHKWDLGDIFVFDNVTYSHARLACDPTSVRLMCQWWSKTEDMRMYGTCDHKYDDPSVRASILNLLMMNLSQKWSNWFFGIFKHNH